MTTPVLGATELVASQSQPHIPVNSALRLFDAVVQLAVDDRLAAPVGTEPTGTRYIVTTGTGAFAGQDGKLALRNETGWVFYQPLGGWLAWVKDEDKFYYYNTGASPDAWEELATGGTAPTLDGARFTRTGSNQNVLNSTDTALFFDTVEFDTGSYQGTFGAGRDDIDITATGTYIVSVHFAWDFNTSGERDLWLKCGPNGNGTDPDVGDYHAFAPDAKGTHRTYTGIVQLTGGEKLSAWTWQDSGGTRQATDLSLSIHRLS